MCVRERFHAVNYCYSIGYTYQFVVLSSVVFVTVVLKL